MPKHSEGQQTLFDKLKQHKVEATLVGGAALLVGASVLTRRRLMQPGAVARYTSWANQRGGGHLVVMSVGNKPTMMFSDVFNWSNYPMSRGRVGSLALRTQTAMPKLSQLDFSMPFSGRGPSQDHEVSAEGLLGYAHVTVSMQYLDGECDGLLNFNLARQAYRVANGHFSFNHGLGLLLNTGVIYGALTLAESMPQATLVAAGGLVTKTIIARALERHQNMKADDAAVKESSDFALEQAFKCEKAAAVSEIAHQRSKQPTFFNGVIYRISGLFGHHQEPVSRALKLGKALEERQEPKGPLAISGGSHAS